MAESEPRRVAILLIHKRGMERMLELPPGAKIERFDSSIDYPDVLRILVDGIGPLTNPGGYAAQFSLLARPRYTADCYPWNAGGNDGE